MSNASLCTFAEKVRANNRIRFGDLRRLQRDVLPRGLSSREDAELLLGLDRAIKKTDEGWPAHLATLVKDFVIATCVRPGCVDRPTAQWLISSLAGNRSATALAIGRAILLDAAEADDELRAFVLSLTKHRGKPATTMSIALPHEASDGRGGKEHRLRASFSFPWQDAWVSRPTDAEWPRSHSGCREEALSA